MCVMSNHYVLEAVLFVSGVSAGFMLAVFLVFLVTLLVCTIQVVSP